MLDAKAPKPAPAPKADLTLSFVLFVDGDAPKLEVVPKADGLPKMDAAEGEDVMPKLEVVPKADVLPNAGLADGVAVCGAKLNALTVLLELSVDLGDDKAPKPNAGLDLNALNAEAADADGFSLLGANLNADVVVVVEVALVLSAVDLSSTAAVQDLALGG